jgi:DNA-binding CsgD family transcriptional regulator
MKGGTIKGNMNDAQNPIPCGGGVLVYNYGIFTMEGGVIMNNAAQLAGGGFYTGGWGTFKKTGGILSGSNAPAAYQNTALTALGVPPGYGHSVGVAEVVQLLLRYRSDTVKENDTLSYTGNAKGNGIFGTGEKWDTHDKALLRLIFMVVLPILAFVVGVLLILRKRYIKKLIKIVQEAADSAADAAPNIDLESMGLTDREKEICELLLTDRTLKEIALILELSYSGTNFHAQKLYAKLGIQNRTELLVRVSG